MLDSVLTYVVYIKNSKEKFSLLCFFKKDLMIPLVNYPPSPILLSRHGLPILPFQRDMAPSEAFGALDHCVNKVRVLHLTNCKAQTIL